MLPAVNGRILNKARWNIGSATRVSMMQKITRIARPAPMRLSTIGLVQPIVWPPYGWMP